MLGIITQERALRLIKDEKAKILAATKTKILAVVDLTQTADQQNLDSKLQTVYRETLSNANSLLTSKRARINGLGQAQFIRWDQGLTFTDLRKGRIESAGTRERRAAAREQRAFQKH
jgi:hypothetical protein